MDNPKNNNRWWMLLLSSVFMFGSYFCYDIPSAIKPQIQSRFNDLSSNSFEVLFNLLYSLYSMPNIILPCFGGFLIDRFGLSYVLVSYCSLLFLGNLILALGCSYKSFLTMLIGRMIFGFGGENLAVGQSVLMTSWFKKTELAFVLGLCNSIATMGTVSNNLVGPWIATKFSVSSYLWFSIIVIGIALIATTVVARIQKQMELQEGNLNQQYGILEDVKQNIRLQDILSFRWSFWTLSLCGLVIVGCILPFNNIATSVLLERNYFKKLPLECSRCGVGAYVLSENCTFNVPSCELSDRYAYPLPLLSANCVVQKPEDQLLCSISPPWISSSSINCDDEIWSLGPKTKTYCARKNAASSLASTMMSIPFTVSIFLSPLMGYVVGKFGMKAVLLMLSPLISTCAHFLLAWTNMQVWIPMVLQGFSYSIFTAAIWPCIPVLVDEYHVGTAFGIAEAFVNLGLSILPILVATVYNICGENYIPNVEILFTSLGMVGVIIGGILNYQDYKNGWVLNRPKMKQMFPYLDPEEQIALLG